MCGTQDPLGHRNFVIGNATKISEHRFRPYPPTSTNQRPAVLPAAIDQRSAASTVPGFTVSLMRLDFYANTFDKSAEFFPFREVITRRSLQRQYLEMCGWTRRIGRAPRRQVARAQCSSMDRKYSSNVARENVKRAPGPGPIAISRRRCPAG